MQTRGNDIDVQVNGITICYDDFGDTYVPLIFIHGFPFDKSMWQPQMDYFKNSRRVIAYDISGFGKSTVDDENLSINLFADDLIDFMDVLQIPQAHICGLSMGGYIALNAASRYEDRFKSMILCDTQCIADSPETKEKRSNSIKQIEKSGVNEFAEGFVKNVFCKDSLKDKKDLVKQIKNIILSTSPKTITGTLTALAQRWETCSELHEMIIPTLIICGREDTVTPLAQSEFLHKNIKDSILKVIEKAGHMSNLEQPEAFNKHLKSFLK